MSIDYESLKDKAVVAAQNGVTRVKELTETGIAKAKELADIGVEIILDDEGNVVTPAPAN